MTMAVPGPILREKMPPYCLAHDRNLRLPSVLRGVLDAFAVSTSGESVWWVSEEDCRELEQ